MRAHGYKLVTRVWRYTVTGSTERPDGTKVDLLREFYEARIAGTSFQGQPCAWLARVPVVKAGMDAIAREGFRSGCFENVTTHPSPTPGRWLVYIRQVWFVPEGRDLPVSQHPVGVDYGERQVEQPWRTDVMKAMALACRYPKVMLSKLAEGVPAYRLVQARKGLRLAATYGDFRYSRHQWLGG